MCYSGEYTLEEMKKKINGKGGIVSYLGTNDFREIQSEALAGNTKSKLIFDAFIYQMGELHLH